MDKTRAEIRSNYDMLDEFSSIITGVNCCNRLFGVRVKKVTLTESAAWRQKFTPQLRDRITTPPKGLYPKVNGRSVKQQRAMLP